MTERLSSFLLGKCLPAGLIQNVLRKGPLSSQITSLSVTVIKIGPVKKFGGAWCAFEAPGVEPAFTGPSGKQ
jgi:hypothetical protein